MRISTPYAWKEILEEKCVSIEQDILGFSFENHRPLLMRALLRKAAFKDQNFPVEFRKYGFQNGLDTFGDKFLDFAIFDHFLDKFLSDNVSEKMVNGHREWYSQNVILQEFSLNCIKLQKYVVWGPDEFNKKIWDQSRTKILADSFEALVGAVYKDQGIEGVKKMLQKIKFYEKIDELRFKKGQKK